MKKTLLILVLVSTVCLNACKKDKEEEILILPAEIALVKNNLRLSMDSLDNQMSASVLSLAQTGPDSLTVRNLLIQLYDISSFSKEFTYVNTQYIRQLVEPPQYYQYQGSDFSKDPDFVAAFNAKQPTLSNLYHAPEGFDAVADMHQVISNGQSIAAIEAVFVPEEILGRIILPVIKNQAFDIWVMEISGVQIFDQDTSTVGHCIFTDPIYDGFEALKTAAHKIAGNAAGHTTYSYYLPGTTTNVNKDCYWDTFTIHGTDWKIVWVKPL